MEKRQRSYAINILALLVVFGAFTAVNNAGLINKYYMGIIITIGINMILACSLNLVTGFLGELALGHAGFMSVGAYAAALFTMRSGLDAGIGFPMALLFGGLVAAVVGVLIGIPALRLRGDYLAIITLGFGEIIRILIIYLEPLTGGARGLLDIPRITDFNTTYWVVAVTVMLLYALIRSRHGRAIVAIREDIVAAGASGIPTTYYKVLAFTVGAFFAGVAGGLYAHYVGMLNPTKFNFNYSIDILVMVVLGGMGSLTGSMLSAVVLTILPEALRQFSDYRMLLYSLLLIVMMLFKPSGLLGHYEFSLTRLLDRIASRLGIDQAVARRREKKRLKSATQPQPGKPLLTVSDLGIAFGGLQAVQGVNLDIQKGEIVGLIGPNGAGKTTVFNMLTSVYQPTTGSIELNGHSIVGKKTYETNRQGVARTFQNIRLFKEISVLDNVKIAMHNQAQYSMASGIFRYGKYWGEEAEMDQRARALLEVFQMGDLADSKAKNLPYGQQRKLEIARALASNPQLLLLDEPAAGMNPIETQELMETIRLIRDRFQVAILLIEHDMSLVMGICERIVVLDYGKIIATGTPEEIKHNPKVIGAYLGE